MAHKPLKAPTSSIQEMLSVYPNNPVQFIGNAPLPVYDPQYGHNIPLFNKWVIPTMLRDGRVRFGLQMLKGPIQYNTVFIPEEKSTNPALIDLLKANGAEFIYKVSANTPEETDFAVSTLKRFWTVGLDDALSAIEWGFSCSQVVYRVNQEENNRIEYDYLKWNHPDSVKPLFLEHRLVGACLKGVPGHEHGVDLLFPKILWHIHNRKVNPIFGESRLQWCMVPWHELYVCYGARDIRRTWFIKNAFDGGEMRYPIGKTKIGEAEIDNLDLAVRMMSNMRTGGFRVFPDDINATSGQQKWGYTPPTANVTPNGLMEYPKELRYEILEALGIPPEVTESQSDNGMGSATGRKVPMMLYYSTLAHLCDSVIYDFKMQCLDYLTFVNFQTKNIKVERVSLEDATPEMGMGVPGEIPEGGSTPIVEQTEEDTGLQV
jgi:hypothetical protein